MLTKGEVKFETMYLQTGWKKINGEYVSDADAETVRLPLNCRQAEKLFFH